MRHDFIEDLLHALNRVIDPNISQLREILIISGMPEKTENLRYLSFNRQVISKADRTLQFSAVAVINNRRVDQWRLEGHWQKLSQVIFSTRWTRNPLDLFINNIRCHRRLMDLLASCPMNYTLLGILDVTETTGAGLSRRRHRSVRPVLAVPGIDPDALTTVTAFESANEVRRRKLPFQRKAEG